MGQGRRGLLMTSRGFAGLARLTGFARLRRREGLPHGSRRVVLLWRAIRGRIGPGIGGCATLRDRGRPSEAGGLPGAAFAPCTAAVAAAPASAATAPLSALAATLARNLTGLGASLESGGAKLAGRRRS